MITYYSHNVSGFMVGKQISASIHYFAVCILCFTSTQAANGDTWCVSGDHLLAAMSAKVEVKPTLNDTEEILRFWVFVGSDTAIKPSD